MNGAGHGWDDCAILACLPLCLAGDILLDQSEIALVCHWKAIVLLLTDQCQTASRYGLGKDAWMLAPEDITQVIYVSANKIKPSHNSPDADRM